MAKGKKRGANADGTKVVCRNRRALHEYTIEDKFEAGLALLGTEVKSLRAGYADLSDAYAKVEDGQLLLIGAHIAPYDKASHFNHDPRRQRILLVHKAALTRLAVKTKERGYTLVALEIYFSVSGWAKVLIGLAKGRKQYDNRDAIRKHEDRRALRDAHHD
ncbi:MAG: SsrA-binding protein SmpB [Myxococcota bacterium]|jgi:SsrA-binding protein|nr:SsrA-binding protein SmpB [Myxococcota bacterium]